MAIIADLRDPRIKDVTVTRVEVSPDMRNAKVHVSVMGDDTKQALAIRGLESSAGFLQSKVAGRIDTRYTPRLTFKLDDGIKKSIAIAKMLAEVLPPEPDAEPIDGGTEPADGENAVETAPEASPKESGD